jgi:hypothetical protein
VNYPIIPNRPLRGTSTAKSTCAMAAIIYLSYPFKDAAHLEGMAAETNNYYSAWRPVTVYVNGAYFRAV